MGLIIFPFAEQIIHVFNKQADYEVLQLGLLCVRIQCLSLVFHALSSLINMFYVGIGDAKFAMAMNLARQGYCFYPALLIAPMIWGINGVACTQAIADILSVLVIVPLGLHALKVIRQKEETEPVLYREEGGITNVY